MKMLSKNFNFWILFGLLVLNVLIVDVVLADEEDKSDEDVDENTVENDNEPPSGKYQSPIDIEVSIAEVNNSLAIQLQNYEKNISPIVTLFDGQTIKLLTKYVQNKPEVIYDNNHYLLSEIHFHWGEDLQNGSEHSFNGEFYAMEAHLVHYSNRYPNAYRAQKHQDGLLVMSVLFRLDNSPNPRLDELLQIVSRVSGRQIDTMSADRLTPGNILPQNRDHFFTYFGSLTTMPFSESVRWILMADTPNIGENQLNQIRRTAQYNSRGMLDGWRGFSNTRDQMPLNGRKVQTNSNEQMKINTNTSPSTTTSSSSSSSSSNPASSG